MVQRDVASVLAISIHAPRVGSDAAADSNGYVMDNFYPRSPRGERQVSDGLGRGAHDFYPRSPRGERRVNLPGGTAQKYFYPRSPRGERLISGWISGPQ